MTAKSTRVAWAERRREEYRRLHGWLPECACGCGQEVSFSSSSGKPNRLADRSHQSQACDLSQFALMRWGKENVIPVDKFREVVRRLKSDRGWTWEEMARAGGIKPGALRALMSDKRKKYVKREWAATFLRSLASEPISRSGGIQSRTGPEIKINGRRSTQRFAERL